MCSRFSFAAVQMFRIAVRLLIYWRLLFVSLREKYYKRNTQSCFTLYFHRFESESEFNLLLYALCLLYCVVYTLNTRTPITSSISISIPFCSLSSTFCSHWNNVSLMLKLHRRICRDQIFVKRSLYDVYSNESEPRIREILRFWFRFESNAIAYEQYFFFFVVAVQCIIGHIFCVYRKFFFVQLVVVNVIVICILLTFITSQTHISASLFLLFRFHFVLFVFRYNVHHIRRHINQTQSRVNWSRACYGPFNISIKNENFAFQRLKTERKLYDKYWKSKKKRI